MNISAEAIKDNRNVSSVLAWPYRGRPVLVTEDQVREKVTTTLEAEFDLSPGQLADDTLIKKDLSADSYELAAPIMTIENFFRTLLQEELARDDLSIGLIVDRLTGRQDSAADRSAGNDCACAA